MTEEKLETINDILDRMQRKEICRQKGGTQWGLISQD